MPKHVGKKPKKPKKKKKAKKSSGNRHQAKQIAALEKAGLI